MKMSLINKVDQFNDDVDIAHQIVHGDSTTTVTTEGGPVRSLAKLIADKDAEFVGGNIVQQAVAARDDSEAARDVAVLAKDAAMVGAVTYPDEATGRAAVVDGEYFKVIGSGDVAAREYRRTNASTSVLVAEYPSVQKIWGRDNIKTAFLYNGTLNSGDLLSTAQKDGLYIVATPSEHADAPENANDILSLEVRRLYGSGDWIHQIARQFARPDNAWARRLRISQGVATSWFPISGKDVTTHGSKIIDNTITRSKLNESFMDAGSLSSGSVNQPLKPGFYIVYSDTVTDLPEGIGGGHAGILEVLGQSSDGIMIQRVMHNGKPEERWVRRCRPFRDEYGEWFFDGTQPEPVINYPYDRLAGKKIVLFGDSLTANQLIPTYVAGSLPQSEIIDLSIGGTRIAKHPSAGWEDLSGWVIATAINTGDWTRVLNGADIVNSEGNYNYIVNKMNIASEVDWSDVDYIVAGYGTNDFSGTPIGELTSATHTEFCGGVNIFIEQILSQYPHIRLLFWTPPWQRRTQTHPAPGIEGGSDVSPNSIGKYLYEYADAMIEIGKMKKQIVIDMYRESGIYETTHQYYLSDLLHVTNAGARILADKIVGALQSKF